MINTDNKRIRPRTPTPTLLLPLRGKGREQGALLLPLAEQGEGRDGGSEPAMNGPLRRNTDHSAVARARALRRSMTVPERIVWSRIRGGALGFRFRRQHPFGAYILDFYCPDLHLCVEIDGQEHSERISRDAVRDAALAASGVRTLRISASDVMRDTDACLQWLWEECKRMSECL